MRAKLYVPAADENIGKDIDWSKASRVTFPNLKKSTRFPFAGSAAAPAVAVDASSTASGKTDREGAVGNARGRACSQKIKASQ
jgi:hypothetical protein